MARWSTPTLLSPERFFSIIGVNPPHASGGRGETYFPDINQCSDVFYQYMWQHQNNISREEIGVAIGQAESDIALALGYSVAPHWIEQELRNYPRVFYPNAQQWGMSDVRGMPKSVQLTEGKFIAGGRRTSSLITAGVVVVYSDDDGDGFDETATVTTATSVTNKNQVHIFYAGKSGAIDWEIKTPRSVTLSAGTIVFKFWSWQFFKPELTDAFPRTTAVTNTNQYGVQPVNIEDVASYVAAVDVYWVYNSTTEVSATFYWERASLWGSGLWPGGWCCSSCNNAGCAACEFITQDGCLHVKDAAGTNAVPLPATYDSDAGQWNFDALTVCRNPDLVKVWYYAGEQGQDYLSGRSTDPLSDFWAETIAMLATAKVPRPFCTCNNSLAIVGNRVDGWQRDLSFTGSKEQGQFQISRADLDCPWGTKAGQVLAWKRVNRLVGSLMTGAAV